VPRPRPLSPEEARHSLANRLGIKVADKLRQLNTKLGVRPTRVWLVWRKWDGGERGQGDPVEVKRIEILPTPMVGSLDAVTFSVFHAGTVPAGSVKLTEVSLKFTYDELTGRMLLGQKLHSDNVPQPWEFYYELVEDGRGDPEPVHQRFRFLSYPRRDSDNCQWVVMLQKMSEDDNRQGQSEYLGGTQG
jgi:hypothetical protein